MLNLNIWNVAFTVINLLVLYLFMKHFLIGPVRSILDERKQMIEHDLDEAKNRETEARQMKEQYQASIGNADEEASRIIEEARNRAAAEGSGPGQGRRCQKDGRGRPYHCPGARESHE